MIKFSLKLKIVLAASGAFLVCGVFGFYFIVKTAQNSFIEVAKENIDHANKDRANNLRNIFKERLDFVKNIAAQEKVVNYLKGSLSPTSQNKNILELLNSYNISGDYSAIYIMARDGTTLVSTNPTSTGKNYGFRNYFKRAMAGESWIDTAVGVTSKELGYYFSHPINSSEGKTIGVIVTKMKPEYIHNHIHSDKIHEFEKIMLTDDMGIVINSTDPVKVFKSLGTLTDREESELERKRRFEEINIEFLDYDIILRNLPKKGESFTVDIFDKLDNEREVISAAKIGDYPFYIISENELDPFIKKARSIAYMLNGVAFIATVCALLIIIYLIYKFLKPIDNLKKGALQYGEGNFGYKLKIKSGDELEDLGTVFNKMSKKISESQGKTRKDLSISKRVNKILVGRELVMKRLKKDNAELKKELRNKKSKSK